jgi:hypothetical protein
MIRGESQFSRSSPPIGRPIKVLPQRFHSLPANIGTSWPRERVGRHYAGPPRSPAKNRLAVPENGERRPSNQKISRAIGGSPKPWLEPREERRAAAGVGSQAGAWHAARQPLRPPPALPGSHRRHGRRCARRRSFGACQAFRGRRGRPRQPSAPPNRGAVADLVAARCCLPGRTMPAAGNPRRPVCTAEPRGRGGPRRRSFLSDRRAVAAAGDPTARLHCRAAGVAADVVTARSCLPDAPMPAARALTPPVCPRRTTSAFPADLPIPPAPPLRQAEITEVLPNVH